MEVDKRAMKSRPDRKGANHATCGPQRADCWRYIENVKNRFADEKHIYHQFLDILQDFKALNIDTSEVITRMAGLFHGNEDLLLEFNPFLPPSFSIWFTHDKATAQTVTGFLGPRGFEEFPRFIDEIPMTLPQTSDSPKPPLSQ